MPRHPKKSNQRTIPCPVQGCCTEVRSSWGFTQHIVAFHPGMDLQYPGEEDKLVELPSSDIDQTSSPPLAPSLNIPTHFSDSDFTGAIPSDLNLDPSEHYSGDEASIPAASIDFHTLINGTYINYVILQLLNE